MNAPFERSSQRVDWSPGSGESSTQRKFRHRKEGNSVEEMFELVELLTTVLRRTAARDAKRI
jgi:hypothetical protein